MKAAAIAPSNIALVKYWGKRNEKLILPQNSSISMTLDNLFTTTTVEFSPNYPHDGLEISGQRIFGEELGKVSRHLDIIRKLGKTKLCARVVSENNFPKAAGLASSASGFAALTLAATAALGLKLGKKELSIIARQGSGSACRSFDSGFSEWEMGKKKDGTDSFAKQIADELHWKELAMVVLVLTTKEKNVKSRAGMKQTVENCPYYPAWLKTIEADLKNMRKAIKTRDFTLLGKTAELNALKMHATMHTTTPPIIYWEPETIALMKEVLAMREEGIECYFTIDGGPQVKVLCQDKDVQRIEARLKATAGVQRTIVCHAGRGARLAGKHLF